MDVVTYHPDGRRGSDQHGTVAFYAPFCLALVALISSGIFDWRGVLACTLASVPVVAVGAWWWVTRVPEPWIRVTAATVEDSTGKGIAIAEIERISVQRPANLPLHLVLRETGTGRTLMIDSRADELVAALRRRLEELDVHPTFATRRALRLMGY
ncbi:hypothetical protein QE364_002985 [Nocardioides zeae]|uniref:Uncharacterized protein n=1 Tax=Nocardioides zeae TaxID=1457234 RepID=A0ACC6IKP0_9ACTN|nr:hypothetical protein [Nocardioides zeae]MDR6175244.1 hypothetical protein [Nocardioides zeae]MDR6211264.1 hypothetical protein [Nocardioides zeae]